MKDWLKSYQHFSAGERRGVTTLVIIIVVLLASRITMHYIVPSISLVKTDNYLLNAWDQYKDKHTVDGTYSKNDAGATSTLFIFDPNVLDSSGFIKLGMKPKTTHLLLNWRRKGKVFYKKEDLKALYTLSVEQYQALAPYISIRNSNIGSPDHASGYYPSYPSLPDRIEINSADSVLLVRLKGIGPFFSHKILERRRALGGYIQYEQLMEAYKFSDSTFRILQERLIIDPQLVQKIRVNIATEEQLNIHPYIGEKMAKNIILYRDAVKRFEKIDQLRLVPLMNEEIYRKIAPYLSTD